jgi:hypothetical protein
MILDAMPSNLPEAASKDILASLTLMRTMLPRSPGEDEQNWLLGLIDQLKSQLSSRRLMTIPTSTRLCGSPIDIHLADPSPSGNAASPVDDGHEIAETIADYAGPPPLSFQAQFNLDIPISNPARSESDNL